MKKCLSGILGFLVVSVLPQAGYAVELNEIRIYQDPGWGSDKYFELAGAVGEDISACQYIVLTGSGFVTTEFRLFGTLGDGFFAASPWDVNPVGDTHVCTGYDFYVQAPLSQPGGLWFPQTGNVTYLVVRLSGEPGDFGAEWGMDLDVDDDGILEGVPWVEILDSVTVVHSLETGGNLYGASSVGPEAGGIVPHHVIKCGGEWRIGEPEVCSDDTIGEANCVPVAVVGPVVASSLFGRHGAYPNPFNPQTTIGFDLNRRSRVSLRIFDVAGRQVRTLLEREVATGGRNEVGWNGRDASGRPLSSGVFFYRIESGGVAETGRLVLAQ